MKPGINQPEASSPFTGLAPRRKKKISPQEWMVLYHPWIQRICLPVFAIGGKLEGVCS
jgi:hypothetical protein